MTLPSPDFRVEPADYAADFKDLRNIREPVFVIEQQVPIASAHHLNVAHRSSSQRAESRTRRARARTTCRSSAWRAEHSSLATTARGFTDGVDCAPCARGRNSRAVLWRPPGQRGSLGA